MLLCVSQAKCKMVPYVSTQICLWLQVTDVRGNLPVFLFGTAATACHKTNNTELQDKYITVCSNVTHLALNQRIKVRKRCKPTALMRYRMWLTSHSPNSNNQTTSPSQTEGRNKPSQRTNQGVQQPTKKIIRLFLNKNSGQESPPIKLETKTNKPRQKRHI